MDILIACDRAGLKVLGKIEDGLGMDGGVVVVCAYGSARLEALDPVLWRTCPHGAKHTSVVPR